MNDTMPDREAYELQISLLKQQIEKIKRDTSYRKLLTRNLGEIKFLIEQWKEIQSSGSLDTDDLIWLTISHLERLNGI